MKVLIAIPVMGSFEIGRISLYQWDRTASPDASFLLIDNSPQPSPYSALFEREFLEQKRWIYHPNAENVGLIRSAQQAYNFALGMNADILVLTHNDVWVYPQSVGFHCPMGWEGWVESLEHLFAPEGYDGHWILTSPDGRTEKKTAQWGNMTGNSFLHGKPGWTIKWVSDHDRPLGVVGLFGSKGCSSSGHRLDTFGSLIEMAGHGRRMTDWIEPAVCLDGFFLACAMPMLKAAVYTCDDCDGIGRIDESAPPCPVCHGTGKQTGGFDQRYTMHHVYDYDIALTSIELGYRNAVVNIPCHHLSGLTANNAAYATSGQDVHQANYERWLAKWQSKLGLTVDTNWNYTWERK